jgi:hypothetical protein
MAARARPRDVAAHQRVAGRAPDLVDLARHGTPGYPGRARVDATADRDPIGRRRAVRGPEAEMRRSETGTRR